MPTIHPLTIPIFYWRGETEETKHYFFHLSTVTTACLMKLSLVELTCCKYGQLDHL